jgi:carboxynorspermidine decarboxylase
MFNGIPHPDLVLRPTAGPPQILRRYTFADYKNRMA